MRGDYNRDLLCCPRCGNGDLEQIVVSEVFVRVIWSTRIKQMISRLVTLFRDISESSEICCLTCGYQSEDYEEWVQHPE